jgi:hypothetical protein
MKISLLLGAVCMVVMVGCSDATKTTTETSTNAPTGGNVATAPVDYLKSAADSHHSAVKTVDITSVKKAIDMFNVQEGRFPNDLNELVSKKYMPEVPTPPVGSALEYDAKTGTVKRVTK